MNFFQISARDTFSPPPAEKLPMPRTCLPPPQRWDDDDVHPTLPVSRCPCASTVGHSHSPAAVLPQWLAELHAVRLPVRLGIAEVPVEAWLAVAWRALEVFVVVARPSHPRLSAGGPSSRPA